MWRPPEAAVPGEGDSAPDTTAAYVGDPTRDMGLADALDDALDAPEVGARAKGGIGGHSGDRLRHGLYSAAEDDGVDVEVAAAAGPTKL